MRKRNKFSLSNTKLLSCKMGYIVPICLTEVIPGDTIQQATSLFVRTAPLVAPVMHPVHVKIHHWYVPHRLVWDDFESFITGGDTGMDDSVMPTITADETDGFAVGSLADYLGCPPGVAGLEVSALPFRAYNLIWNECYRDQDLQTALTISTASGADSTTSIDLQRAAWEKDYFTTARPWPQKGPGVFVPVGAGDMDGSITGSPTFGVFPTDSTPRESMVPNQALGAGQTGKYGLKVTNIGNETMTRAIQMYGNLDDAQDPHLNNEYLGTKITVGKGTLAVNFTNTDIGRISLDDIREAFALQRFEEARSLYGSRYVEYLRYLGIKASDGRLQRPEYLGGGRQTLQFSEVLQTAEGTDPVGTLRGHGIGAMRTNRYRRFFEEHGYIVSVMIVRPKAIYAQGLPRTFNRRTRYDFFQRELQNIGEQEVLNKEVYAAAAQPDGVFGYQARYDEYRRHESSVAGEFRDVLDYWHMARVFDNAPALNSSFISAVPTDRVFAATTYDQLYVMAQNSIQARRMVRR